MKTVTVSTSALVGVLQALIGPPHLVRELQATRSIDTLTGSPNPINVLIKEYSEAEASHKAMIAAVEAGARVEVGPMEHPRHLYEHALNEVLMLGYTIKDGDLFPPETGIPAAPCFAMSDRQAKEIVASTAYKFDGVDIVRATERFYGIQKQRAQPSVQHLPADDTEGGEA